MVAVTVGDVRMSRSVPLSPDQIHAFCASFVPVLLILSRIVRKNIQNFCLNLGRPAFHDVSAHHARRDP